jgi:TonB family protein
MVKLRSFAREVFTVFFVIALVVGVAKAWAGDASPAYTKDCLIKIYGKVVYPRMAKLRQQEGEVGIAVTVDGSGGASNVAIESSSGVQSLDDAAVQAAKDAAPFSAPAEAGIIVHGKIKFSMGE